MDVKVVTKGTVIEFYINDELQSELEDKDYKKGAGPGAGNLKPVLTMSWLKVIPLPIPWLLTHKVNCLQPGAVSRQDLGNKIS